MKIVITKQNVIDGLTKEPIFRLRPGAWMDRSIAKQEDCPRCAVGCVLANVLSDRNGLGLTLADIVNEVAGKMTSGYSITPEDFGGDEPLTDDAVFDEAMHLLSKQKQPVAALSCYFEGHCDIRRAEREELSADPNMQEVVHAAREDTIVFVRNHFPESFIVDINGFEPMTDVKVVEGT
jgi:hypothetical protein